ncbi:MAG: proline iminopeptidase-family hydrolase, partial [Mogibacterium sp.]|nr:proline iminopeptidase-family hydrolase [Mogibacterium sp.]
YLEGHPELWTLDIWMNELFELRKYLGLDECHIIGQSWGGMMQIAYGIDYKDHLDGVKSFIISSGHPSSSLWERKGLRRIKMMPQDMQDAINHALETGDFTGEAYDAAVTEYMDRYCNYWLGKDAPECCTRPKKSGGEAYLYGWGPNEFAPTGTLKDFEYVDRLGEIEVPSIIMSGISDLCSPLVAKTMHDGIKGSKWILWERARHTCFVDRHDDYCVELIKWMNEHDK